MAAPDSNTSDTITPAVSEPPEVTASSNLPAEWTTLENLVLVQAVYKHGADAWSHVARTLRGCQALVGENARISDEFPEGRTQEFYAPKNCERQYLTLLSTLPFSKRSSNETEIERLAALAQRLHLDRVNHIKNLLKKDEDEFIRLVVEIKEIQEGKWDDKLKVEIKEKELLEKQRKEREELEALEKEKADRALRDELARADALKEAEANEKKRKRDSVEVDAGEGNRKASKPDEPTEKATDVPASPVPAPTESPTAKDKDELPPLEIAHPTPIRAPVPLEVLPLEATNAVETTDDVKPGTPTEHAKPPLPRPRSSTPTNTSTPPPAHTSWRRTALFLLSKILDHRYAPVFASTSPFKHPQYKVCVKHPTTLESVRTAVRKNLITTTPTLYRALLLIFTNAVMWNPESSEVVRMAGELREFVEKEMELLVRFGGGGGWEHLADDAKTETESTGGAESGVDV
ncbi:hypothetical protein BC832DRAFT_537055 [Gaertneriomyces semiglobifer]|nr:hypothetical protein BC832DRAFT_537055 [Gaertneriomyces semiglobifer]